MYLLDTSYFLLITSINIIQEQLEVHQRKPIGLLVLLSSDITAFIRTAYQRRSLQRPSREI